MNYARIFKFNPYHDEKGKFAPKNEMASGASSFTPLPQGEDNEPELRERVLEQVRATESQWAALSPETQETVKEYSNNLFGSINTLASGGTLTPFNEMTMGKEARKALAELDKATTSMSLPEDTVLFRASSSPHKHFPDILEAAKFDPSKLEQLVGKTFTEPIFASTSFDNRVARGFMGDPDLVKRAHLTIQAPKGTPGVVIGNYSARTRSPGESEVLLPRGKTFRILSAKYGKLGERDSDNNFMFEVEMV